MCIPEMKIENLRDGSDRNGATASGSKVEVEVESSARIV
jgi:hypothetical protein